MRRGNAARESTRSARGAQEKGRGCAPRGIRLALRPMFSQRLPRSTGLNAWARLLEARRSSGARLIDLTEANPTRVGLGGAGAAELAALADPRGAGYEPDPRG